MDRYLTYGAYGWLTLSGLLHFIIDVLAQALRRRRPTGRETTLYYGLHSAFSLGQVSFGLLSLWLAWRDVELLREPGPTLLSFAAATGWIGVAFLFNEYRPPKVNAVLFMALLLAAAFARGWQFS